MNHRHYLPDYIYFPLIYTLLFIILCFIVKPLKDVPRAIWNGLSDILSVIVVIPVLLFRYLVEFLKGTVPTLVEHLLKLLLALLLFVVRGITWVLQALVRLLHTLFQGINKS